MIVIVSLILCEYPGAFWLDFSLLHGKKHEPGAANMAKNPWCGNLQALEESTNILPNVHIIQLPSESVHPQISIDLRLHQRLYFLQGMVVKPHRNSQLVKV